MRLYRIAALNKVWVEAEVYEADLAHVKVGQAASVTLDYLPGKTYEAKVGYIYPYLNAEARTGRVRVELSNKELELRPGMYASVQLSTEPTSRLQVPTSAVIYTGPRRLVFVDLGEGRFRPQEVQIGGQSGENYEVLSGLAAGDSVAVSGVFLIAAEARISTAAKYWDKSEAVPAQSPMPEPSAAPPSSPVSTTPPKAPSPPMPAPKAPPVAPTHDHAAMTNPAASAPAPIVYTCTMHPQVRMNAPGKCPICGMDLVPITGGAK
jgi:hypothetical protein